MLLHIHNEQVSKGENAMNVWYRLKASARAWWSSTSTSWQLIYGVWKVMGLTQPMVTICGGSRVPQTDPYSVKAHELANRLVQHGISVLTGGGPGIMEAASCGAVSPEAKNGAQTLGIGVKRIDEEKSPCIKHFFKMNNFFGRKWLLTRYSAAVIVFPGGFGTLDELAEILTLVQTRIIKPLPIILIGTEYWKEFLSWMNSEALKHGLVNQVDLQLFFVTDNIEEVIQIVCKECNV